ncbi:hypothetical protein A3767_28900 [Oleiphilus sp. HI0133]|nr:hypothetical protein A3767_28900 [Oleiphilus sp. HI0133]
MNPRTRKIISEYGLEFQGITVIEPVGYLNMVWLIANCDRVMTDSGGLQKEAYFFSKPCITLRDETEWVELVDICANSLVGAAHGNILKAASTECVSEGPRANLYGDGSASFKILERLLGR